ncbi:MAG: hypothetical protein OXH50_10810 [Gemmatimonadetes bacterium]|nr:hypothetical protein [Gemmatimonadota bacterium]
MYCLRGVGRRILLPWRRRRVDWGRAIPFLAERYGMEYLEAKVPTPNYFDLDLGKINRLLGFEPKHDLLSLVETAENLQREDAGVIPTGVR